MDNVSLQGSDEGQTNIKLRWTKQVENMLTKFADTAACYKWLNEKSFRKYRRINYFYAIPVIILSTLSGAISVGMSGYVPEEYIKMAQLGVGGINIINGIFSTLQSFFRYAQLSEGHWNAYVGWSRLHRNIENELTLERKNRKNPSDFVKICRAEYDRLMETNPLLPEDVLQEFETKFDSKKVPDLIIPSIADSIKHTKIYDDKDEEYDSDEKTPREPAKNWKAVKNDDFKGTNSELRKAVHNLRKRKKDTANLSEVVVEVDPNKKEHIESYVESVSSNVSEPSDHPPHSSDEVKN